MPSKAMQIHHIKPEAAAEMKKPVATTDQHAGIGAV
jgi:hypothetical protein